MQMIIENANTICKYMKQKPTFVPDVGQKCGWKEKRTHTLADHTQKGRTHKKPLARINDDLLLYQFDIQKEKKHTHNTF